jgi:hypothetical protein
VHIAHEVKQELERDEPLLRIGARRLKLCSELRDLIDHAGHLIAIRRQRADG